MSCSYLMRYEYFPLFTHGIIRVQSDYPASRQVGSYIRGVSTASGSAIGSTYMRGTQYSHVDRVVLAIQLTALQFYIFLMLNINVEKGGKMCLKSMTVTLIELLCIIDCFKAALFRILYRISILLMYISLKTCEVQV